MRPRFYFFRVYAVIDILRLPSGSSSLALVSKQVSMSRAYLFRGGYTDLSWGHNIVSQEISRLKQCTSELAS